MRRSDRGVARGPKKKVENQTEVGFLRRRRRSTAALAAAAARPAHCGGEDSENDDFDEKQQKALKKQHTALRKRKVQALLDGKLLEGEKSGLEAEAEAELKNRHARARERAGKAARVAAAQQTSGAALLPRLSNTPCWVDSDLKSHDLLQGLRARRCPLTEARSRAEVYIVSDPGSPGRRVLWHALLKGAFVVTPRAFTDATAVRGPIAKYLPANSPARTVHLTEAFTAKHSEIVAILQGHCRSWKFEANLEAPWGRGPPTPPKPGTPVSDSLH